MTRFIIVLYVLGTIVTLLATGFLFGVCFLLYSAHMIWNSHCLPPSSSSNWNLWDTKNSFRLTSLISTMLDVQTGSGCCVHCLHFIYSSRSSWSLCLGQRGVFFTNFRSCTMFFWQSFSIIQILCVGEYINFYCNLRSLNAFFPPT